MVQRRFALLLMLAFFLTGVHSQSWAFTKDQSKLPLSGDIRTAQQASPPESAEPMPLPPDQQGGEDGAAPGNDSNDPGTPDETSLGEIPVISTIELTDDIAKRAVDAFALVKDKYREANLDEFENLQDFVDQAPEGKGFETDVKSFGFSDVTQWNTAISTVGFAYSAMTDDQTEEIRLQVDEITKDSTIAQDMKDRMISSLSAMIPSDNNKKIVEALAADPAYEEKLKLLAEEE